MNTYFKEINNENKNNNNNNNEINNNDNDNNNNNNNNNNKRLWLLKKAEVVPVVVGALGCISKGFSRWMDILGITLSVGMVQKSAVLLGTARILKKVLDM